MQAAHQWPFGPEALFAKQEQPQEGRLEEERKHAFHGQRLADHTAGGPRELRPIGAELKLHGNSGDHTHNEVDPEDRAQKRAARL